MADGDKGREGGGEFPVSTCAHPSKMKPNLKDTRTFLATTYQDFFSALYNKLNKGESNIGPKGL